MHLTDGGRRSPLRGALTWLEATPTEVAGLLVLVVSAAAAAGVLWWRARPAPAPAPTPGPTVVRTATPGRLVVHVAGAVASPGVVTVATGARVVEVIDAAGGPVADADLAALNLARTVEDGERLVVPRRGEPAPSAAPRGPTRSGAGSGSSPIDLNAADAAALETLPGIGPVLAERIVRHRETRGAFEEPGDLREVSGIGEHTFQAVADRITVR